MADLKSRLKRAANTVAGMAGLEIRRVDSASTMEGALARIADAVEIATVVDVGASDGRWTGMAMQALPKAEYLLIEAQEVHRPALATLSSAHARVHAVLAAAGDRPGTIHFDVSDPFGGVASEVPFATADAVVPMTTIDAELERHALGGPLLLKLDTHGFERQVLAGAELTLGRTAAIVVEAYNFTLRPGAMRFHELVEHMDTLGFRPSDAVNVLRRPRDRVLWQVDMVFRRADEPAFEITSYA